MQPEEQTGQKYKVKAHKSKKLFNPKTIRGQYTVGKTQADKSDKGQQNPRLQEYKAGHRQGANRQRM